MNIRKIKLALTVDLLNQQSNETPINMALESMGSFLGETGSYLGSKEIDTTQISSKMELSSIDMLYDHCTLNLEVIRDKHSNKEILQGFNLQEKFS